MPDEPRSGDFLEWPTESRRFTWRIDGGATGRQSHVYLNERKIYPKALTLHMDLNVPQLILYFHAKGIQITGEGEVILQIGARRFRAIEELP